MLKGLGNLANLGSALKQAQEMGTKMQALKDELQEKRVTGAAGGGLIQVDATGTGDVLAVRIDPSLLSESGGDREMIEDLLPAAINDAAEKARQLHTEAMQEITGGLNLPGMGETLSQFTGGQ